ncbi:MAG: YIP1 family protein [Acidobacteriota bacterium]|nr:YIP1 family protein [Acidobacteriota bacterium]
MSTLPVPEPATQTATQPESSAVSRMTGVVFSPARTFAEIARRPTWVAPFVVLCLLSIGVSALLAQKTDWRGFFERQMSKNSRTEQLPQDQKDRILESQVKYAPKFTYAFGLLGTAIFVLLTALVYWGAFNLFHGAGLDFKTAFAIVTHACVPLAISSILAIVILVVKHRGDVDPEHFLASNVAAFLPEEAPHWLDSLGQSLELFWIWTMALAAIGFSAANPKKIKPAGAFMTVFGIWAVWVMGKVAWAMF